MLSLNTKTGKISKRSENHTKRRNQLLPATEKDNTHINMDSLSHEDFTNNGLSDTRRARLNYLENTEISVCPVGAVWRVVSREVDPNTINNGDLDEEMMARTPNYFYQRKLEEGCSFDPLKNQGRIVVCTDKQPSVREVDLSMRQDRGSRVQPSCPSVIAPSARTVQNLATPTECPCPPVRSACQGMSAPSMKTACQTTCVPTERIEYQCAPALPLDTTCQTTPDSTAMHDCQSTPVITIKAPCQNTSAPTVITACQNTPSTKSDCLCTPALTTRATCQNDTPALSVGATCGGTTAPQVCQNTPSTTVITTCQNTPSTTIITTCHNTPASVIVPEYQNNPTRTFRAACQRTPASTERKNCQFKVACCVPSREKLCCKGESLGRSCLDRSPIRPNWEHACMGTVNNSRFERPCSENSSFSTDFGRETPCGAKHQLYQCQSQIEIPTQKPCCLEIQLTQKNDCQKSNPCKRSTCEQNPQRRRFEGNICQKYQRPQQCKEPLQCACCGSKQLKGACGLSVQNGACEEKQQPTGCTQIQLCCCSEPRCPPPQIQRCPQPEPSTQPCLTETRCCKDNTDPCAVTWKPGTYSQSNARSVPRCEHSQSCSTFCVPNMAERIILCCKDPSSSCGESCGVNDMNCPFQRNQVDMCQTNVQAPRCGAPNPCLRPEQSITSCCIDIQNPCTAQKESSNGCNQQTRNDPCQQIPTQSPCASESMNCVEVTMCPQKTGTSCCGVQGEPHRNFHSGGQFHGSIPRYLRKTYREQKGLDSEVVARQPT